MHEAATLAHIVPVKAPKLVAYTTSIPLVTVRGSNIDIEHDRSTLVITTWTLDGAGS